MSWNGSPIESQDELDARFSNIRLNNENVEIHIRSSARARYDTAIKVLASAQRHEIKKIGIVGLDEFNL